LTIRPIVSGVARAVITILVKAGSRVALAEMLSILKPRALRVAAIRASTSGRLFTSTAMARLSH
jgi:hypothetical protein